MSDPATHSQEEMDKVIARIQKLLARSKTDRGASEAEADTAMRMAQDLMSKYNLDMAVIEATDGSTDTVRVKEVVKGRAMYKWQRQLAKYVAEANFCYHLVKADSVWVSGHWSDQDPDDANRQSWYGRPDPPENVKYIEGRYRTTFKHVFVGRKANVITAQLMYQYLTQTVEGLLPVADNTQRQSRSATSWKEGCADRLCERLAKKRDDLIKDYDAKARAADAARKAEYERMAREKEASTPKSLPPNEQAEVKSAVASMSAGAYDRSGPKPEAEEQDRPTVDSGDTWTPGAEVPPEAPPSTALVLASVYDEKEREANYEMAHGLPPGYIARRRAERDEEARKEAEEEAKAETERIEAPVKEETERQRKARERRELEQHMKDRRRWAREDAAQQRREEREWAKRDHSAYNAGAEAGKKIGLDLQVKGKADTKKLTS